MLNIIFNKPTNGRSPHGERGLKYKLTNKFNANRQSLSSRRAWIEIVEINTEDDIAREGRSPHGERGLKCVELQLRDDRASSLSSRRAWIEMYLSVMMKELS